MTDRPASPDRRAALDAEIRKRLGLVPAFLRAASSVEVAEQLWSQVRAAYVDSPIPFELRGALTAYLARFCSLPYCMLRHSAFLMRRGGPGRDQPGRPPDAGEVLRLLQRPMPTRDEIQRHLKTLAGRGEPLAGWPEERSGPLGEALFRCSVQGFLGGEQAARCHVGLRRVLGPERHQALVALLGFVRAAHAWAEAHPDLELDDDLEVLLAEEPALRRWIDGYREEVAHERAKGRRLALERARDELERSEALAATVLNTVPDAILSIDEKGVILAVNPATTRLFGYGQSELLGENVRLLMPPPYAKEHDGYLERYRRTGEARIIGNGREVEARRKDGSVFPVRLAVGEAYFDGSHVYTGTLHDLSEVRELQQQLLQSQKLEAIGALAGGVAHDFNNLLTSIRGSSEILIEHLEPGDGLTRSAQRILRAADRATALTTRLLAFSRREAGQKRVVELNELVRDTAELFSHAISEALELELDTASEPIHVLADENQLGQVLMNLVVNAADATPAGGRLAVSTARRGDGRAALTVGDTGEGIPADRLERIFEPFFTTKEPGKGTGLGLSMARAIVLEHGGEMEVQTEVGRGTTVAVLLPEVDAPKSADEVEQAAPCRAASGEAILLVEDDDIARDLLVEVLEGEGYEVAATGSPEEALRLARDPATRLDLLVTDVVMPGMTGPQLAREVRSQSPQLRVLFMSGYTDQALAEHEALEGAAVLLHKPFGNNTLLGRVREMLDEDRSS